MPAKLIYIDFQMKSACKVIQYKEDSITFRLWTAIERKKNLRVQCLTLIIDISPWQILSMLRPLLKCPRN